MNHRKYFFSCALTLARLQFFVVFFFNLCSRKELERFLIYKHITTIIPPYMELQLEKDSGKNNGSSTVVTLNIDTIFMFLFLILQKYLKVKFLTLLPSKFLPLMYIRLSYWTVSKKIEFNLFLSMFQIA